MTVALGLVAGVAAAWLVLTGTRDVLALPSLQRENFRGRQLPTAAGALLVLAVVAVEAGRTLLAVVDVGTPVTPARVLVLAAVLAFGFLGLVDDLLGDTGVKGLRGHLRSASRGVVTTGFLKLAGGAAVALVLAAAADGTPRWQVLVDGAVVALAANLGNLFDRAPGRALKVALVAYVPLALAAGTSAAGAAVAPVAGAAAGFLPGDLRERYMLGDTGANAVGAALGMATVLAVDEATRIAVAVVLLALNVASELVSFTRVIDAVPPLRAVDRAGRLPDGEAGS